MLGGSLCAAGVGDSGRSLYAGALRFSFFLLPSCAHRCCRATGTELGGWWGPPASRLAGQARAGQLPRAPERVRGVARSPDRATLCTRSGTLRALRCQVNPDEDGKGGRIAGAGEPSPAAAPKKQYVDKVRHGGCISCTQIALVIMCAQRHGCKERLGRSRSACVFC